MKLVASGFGALALLCAVIAGFVLGVYCNQGAAVGSIVPHPYVFVTAMMLVSMFLTGLEIMFFIKAYGYTQTK